VSDGWRGAERRQTFKSGPAGIILTRRYSRRTILLVNWAGSAPLPSRLGLGSRARLIVISARFPHATCVGIGREREQGTRTSIP